MKLSDTKEKMSTFLLISIFILFIQCRGKKLVINMDKFQIKNNSYSFSSVVTTKTKCVKPALGDIGRFVSASSRSLTIQLSAWITDECPIIYLEIEYKPKNQKYWSVASYNVKPGRSWDEPGSTFVIMDLNPATWYNLRITAHNEAGFSITEHEFATFTATGGKVRRAIKTKESKNSLDFFLTPPPLSFLTFCFVNISSRPKFHLGILGPELIFTY